ncbi:MAG: DUF4190 domain-containing protein [Flavobacteriales bacterium]
MITARSLLVLFLLGLFASCGHQRNAVVGEGPFQKRKYLPGWHVDLGKRSSVQSSEHPSRTRVPIPKAEEESGTRSYAAETEHPRSGEVYNRSEPIADIAATNPPEPAQWGIAQENDLRSAAPAPGDRDPDNIMPRKRFNVLAIPALLFVLAGILLAFITNSGWLVAGSLVIGLVLAAISLRRIRSREQSGKGFALIAMILGVMAALITTMVIIRTGF